MTKYLVLLACFILFGSCSKNKVNTDNGNLIVFLENLEQEQGIRSIFLDTLKYYSSRIVSNHPSSRIKLLIQQFYGQHQSRFLDQAERRDGILPSDVWLTHQGTCLGNALWLYLLLSQSGDTGVHLRLLPNHVYVQDRYDSNVINLEPNRQGWSYSELEYQNKYSNNFWTGWEMRDLSLAQIKGIVLMQIGHSFVHSDPVRAYNYYQRAFKQFPQFPGISKSILSLNTRIPWWKQIQIQGEL